VSCDAEVGRWCLGKLYYLNVTFLNSNKAFPFQKKSNMKFFKSHIQLSRVQEEVTRSFLGSSLILINFFCGPMGSFRFKDDVFFGKYNDYRVLCYFHLRLLIFRQCYSLKFETK
jgi:hypothetical protein